MNFKGSLDINKPVEEVTRYFIDPQYLGEYQEGFVKKELVSGEAQQNGAVSMMYYAHQGREMELQETITANNLPKSFEAFYHHKHMDNTMKCTFEPLSPNSTRYTYDVEYTRIDWIMPRLMAILFPGMYRKQGKKWMDNFKRFVEAQ